MSTQAPLDDSGAVDLRTILFSAIVLILGCINDYVLQALKTRFPPAFTNHSPEIRALAVRCLALYCHNSVRCDASRTWRRTRAPHRSPP